MATMKPPQWFLWFLVWMLLGLFLDALISGDNGEWLGGVFFGIAIAVHIYNSPLPRREQPAEKTRGWR